MRKYVIMAWLMLLSSAIGALFWYNELVYQLPTPVPAKYVQVEIGTTIKLDGKLENHHRKPVLLHFFNPDCPCSRFNISNFMSLVKRYSKQIDVVVIVLSKKPFTEKEIQSKFKISIPVFFDQNIATACGVYSTPQAALLDTDNKLYYRGNYNRSRYCTDEKTSFAKIAIKGLLQDKAKISFNPLALKAYGCQLPNCTN